MKPIVAQLLRSPWLAALVHAGLWLLLYLAASGLGGTAPIFRESDGTETIAQMPPPIGKLSPLFAVTSWPKITGHTNLHSIFGTSHFIPAPKPAPPPPTTRKIELTYQGYYSVDGKSLVMLKMGDKFLVSAVGANVTDNLFAAQVAVMNLTLTNSAGQTNVLPLNVKKEVEVPIK